MKSSLSAFLRGGILWVALGLVGLPGKSFGQVLVSFGFTGAEQTWVVPSGINSIRIDAGGGGGGGGLSKLGSGGGGATSIFYRLGSGDTLGAVEVGAEEARATQFLSRRTVETAGVRRFPCRDPAGRERRERTAEAEMGPTREGADSGGPEEILAAGQVWEEAKVEACYTRIIVWTDRLTLRF